MFKPPGNDMNGTTGRIGEAMLKQETGKSVAEINAGASKSGDSTPPSAPGSYSMTSKPKKGSSQPTFLGASALPPQGIQSGGGKTLLGQ